MFRDSKHSGIVPVTLVTALIACGALCGVAYPAAAADPEDELKAATVLAFMQHTTWLESEGTSAPLTVGVLGRPAFLEVLRRTVEGKNVNGRPLKAVGLTLPLDPHCCQVYYVATDRRPETERVLAGAAAARVLTIGEAARFLDSGGAIQMFFVDGHISFEASLLALQQCRVTISSKLLRFGRVRDLPKARGPH